jgi:hypothetical protein
MIRSLLRWLISIAKGLMDDTIPEKDLHAYIRKGLVDLNQAIDSGDISMNHVLLPPIIRTVDRLHKQGFPGIPAFAEIPATNPDNGGRTEIGSIEPVVRKGAIVGSVIEDMSRAVIQNRLLGEEQLTKMEALLRHIEVKRQAALRFVDSRSEEGHWHFAARISVLFSSIAQREKDYRFLNTALKLNDWAYRYYRNRSDHARNLHYLWAVLEAEALLLEMTA